MATPGPPGSDLLTIVLPDGEWFDPADRVTLMAWAEQGRIPPDAKLRHPDGREESVLLDDSLGRAVEAAGKDAVQHPGRKELISGAVITGLFGVLMLISAVDPRALMLGPGGKGHYATNMGYWWIILLVGLASGVFLLLRGLSERRRARLAHDLERD